MASSTKVTENKRNARLVKWRKGRQKRAGKEFAKAVREGKTIKLS